MKTILRNLRALVSDDLPATVNQVRDQDKLLAAQLDRAKELERLFNELGARVDSRADTYETAVDKRLDERLAGFEARLDAYQAAVDARIDERVTSLEKRLDEYQSAVDLRIDERLAASEKALDKVFAAYEERSDARSDSFETALTERLTEFETAATKRAGDFESAITERANVYETETGKRLEVFETESTRRADSYEAALDARIDLRLKAVDEGVVSHLQNALKTVDGHFENRNRATDNRLDDRLAHIERHIDARFNTLEKRSDDRMETHERAVDGKLHQRSQDIVDRTDLMLQIFEQRLDKFRRQLREHGAGQGMHSSQTPAPATSTDENVSSIGSTSASDPGSQLTSFRRLAEVGTQSLRKIGVGAPPLYHQILSWKKVAADGLNDFAPDQQEIVDYLLSFVSDEKELAYVKQHLRRFVSTLERVPQVEKTDDRLLELGSLGHLAPAIRKFCGYTEVYCGDFWEGDEKVRTETIRQVTGNDSHSFELRNFNVEADPFPYPDKYFRTVICGELIEHLQRDPLHMLWEINRVLVDDGYLLLTTPNIASARAIEGLLVGCTPYLFPQYNLLEVVDQHNREYAPYEIGVALAAAGFSVVALETEDVWLRSNPAILELLKEIQISPELRGDNIFALARKSGPPIERHPQELYTDR